MTHSKNQAWACIIKTSDAPNLSRNVYVLNSQLSEWNTLKQSHSKSYYHTSIVRALYSLSALAGGRTSSASKHLKLDGAQINYVIDDAGDVRIYSLNIDSEINTTHPSQQASGLYRVEYMGKQWITDKKRNLKMDLNHQWNNSHYAAVSGKFDNKEDAGKKLIKHIHKAYKSAVKTRDSEQSNNHYSLYWQNGSHNKPENSTSLSSLIQQAQTKDMSINWLVHGEGAGTFVQALRQLNKQPAQSLMTAGNNLSNQNVFFSNPRGKDTNTKALEMLCEQAGINYVGINYSQTDLHNEDVRQKLKDEGTLKVAAYGLGGFGAVAGTGNLVKGYDSLGTGTEVAIGIATATAMYVVGKDVSSKFSGYCRNINGAWSSTFGKANENWSS